MGLELLGTQALRLYMQPVAQYCHHYAGRCSLIECSACLAYCRWLLLLPGSSRHTLISMQPLACAPRSYCYLSSSSTQIARSRSLFPGMPALRVATVSSGIALSSARRSPGGPARGPAREVPGLPIAPLHAFCCEPPANCETRWPRSTRTGAKEELLCSSSTGPGTANY